MAKYTADYLTDIRGVLQDNTPASQRWTDPELTEHLGHAVMELSAVIPTRKRVTDLVTVANSKEIDVSAITDLQEFHRLEWPVGTERQILDFFGDTGVGMALLMNVENAPSADDEVVHLYYGGNHTVGAGASTVPLEVEWHIIQIAAILAMIGFTRHGRDSIADAMSRIASANTALSLVTDLVADATQTLADAKGIIGEHNQDAEDRMAEMDAPLGAAQDDLDAGRGIINESTADIDDAIAGSDARIQKAVDFIEDYAAHHVNMTNFGNNVPGNYNSLGNTELGASAQYIAHAHLLLSRDGASNEWFRAASAGISIAQAHVQAAQGHLSMNQEGRDLMGIAMGELQMALSNIQESQGHIAIGVQDLQIAKVIDSYEARAYYQLDKIKADLDRFRPQVTSEICSTSV